MIKIQREQLLHPLNMVAGAVERRHTVPILSHVLLVFAGQRLTVTATDLEVQLSAAISLDETVPDTVITLPGRKLLDICKSLPEKAKVELHIEQNQVMLKSGRSRFNLSTLPSANFPVLEKEAASVTCDVAKTSLQYLLEHTHFAMAQQDVRYFLNGLLFELAVDRITTVSADGHRMAVAWQPAENKVQEATRVIIPRKGITELMRLLATTENERIAVTMGSNHIHFATDGFTLSSKLIDGRFPDYQRALPRGGNKVLIANKDELKTLLHRVAILLDKNRSIRVDLNHNSFKAIVSNLEHEEAEEETQAEYNAEPLSLGFNVDYLLDVFSVMKNATVKMTFNDANTGILFEEEGDNNVLYVIMPMKF